MNRLLSGLNKVAQVAWREVRYTALTPAFLLGVVGVPFALLGLLAIYPLLLSQDARPLTGTFAIVDPTGEVAPQLESVLDQGDFFGAVADDLKKMTSALPTAGTDAPMDPMGILNMEVDLEVLEVSDPAELDALKDALQAGELVGIAVVPPSLLAPTEALTETDGEVEPEEAFELFVAQESAPNQTVTLERIMEQAIVEARARLEGIDYARVQRILERPYARLIRVSASGEKPEDIRVRMILPIALMLLLWISTFTSGNYVLTTTIEEKSNRVMEVLLSAVSPMQLMSGKIIGHSIVAAFMLVMYGGMVIGALALLAMADLISIGLIVLSIVYFVIAYFTVASIMAAIGSAVSDLRDAQSLMGPAVLVLILPLILWMPISNHPDSALSIIAGFIPPLIPFVMILRVAGSTEPLPAWQIAASLVLGGASVIGMLWMCARIFRVGVLMQGKPPSPLELIRWMRYR